MLDRAKKNETNRTYNSRINILMAIVFLLGAAVIARLGYLQIVKHGYYAGKASGQHETENRLPPERGEIFWRDTGKAGSEILYPFATNKQYFLVYAIPKEVKDPVEAQDIAQKLYFVFDREQAEKEVDDLFQKQDEVEQGAALAKVSGLPGEEKRAEEARINRHFAALRNDKAWREERQRAKEAEVEKKKKEIVGEYLAIYSQADDPYAPLKKKVEEGQLLRLYSILVKSEDGLSIDDLVVRGGRVYRKMIMDSQEEKWVEVRPNGVYHSAESYRYYPENNIGSHLLGFARLDGNVLKGNYGLEGFFDHELTGEYGYLKSETGANRNMLILDGREYVKPKNGTDLVLTIDRSVQYFACQKAKEASEKHRAEGVTILAVDPKTGAIITMCSWPDFDPNNYQKEKDLAVFNNPSVFDQYEPGSVFKAITMAGALDDGKVTPETVYEDKGQIMKKGWQKPIQNADFTTSGPHGRVNMTVVLERSLNTGAIFAMEQLGQKKFIDYIKDFGFGERTGIELEAESPGNIENLLKKKVWERDLDAASFGQAIMVTPLQMIMSYAAIANGGVLMKPYIVSEMVHEDGTREVVKPREVRRVISDRTASLLSGMLVSVVENGHSKKAQIDGYFIGGKTGTAQIPDKTGYSDKNNHTFIGIAPAGDPKFVILVKITNPKDFEYADYTATPLFQEIADFMLKYYQVPKER